MDQTPASHPPYRPRASLDGFVPPAQKARRPLLIAKPAPTVAAPQARTAAKPKKAKKWLPRLKDISTVIIALILGLVVQSVLLGQVVLIIYALCVFIFRVESRTTFLLAIMSLGVILIASARADQRLAGTFGVYSFILLAIGTISLGREVRNEW